MPLKTIINISECVHCIYSLIVHCIHCGVHIMLDEAQWVGIEYDIMLFIGERSLTNLSIEILFRGCSHIGTYLVHVKHIKLF